MAHLRLAITLMSYALLSKVTPECRLVKSGEHGGLGLGSPTDARQSTARRLTAATSRYIVMARNIALTHTGGTTCSNDKRGGDVAVACIAAPTTQPGAVAAPAATATTTRREALESVRVAGAMAARDAAAAAWVA
jgi:hypothetical protein